MVRKERTFQVVTMGPKNLGREKLQVIALPNFCPWTILNTIQKTLKNGYVINGSPQWLECANSSQSLHAI